MRLTRGHAVINATHVPLNIAIASFTSSFASAVLFSCTNRKQPTASSQRRQHHDKQHKPRHTNKQTKRKAGRVKGEDDPAQRTVRETTIDEILIRRAVRSPEYGLRLLPISRSCFQA